MRTQVLIASALAIAAWPCAALGSVVVSLNNPGSTTLHVIEVQPGDTFNMDVNLQVEFGAYMVSFALRASTGNVFEVTEIVDTSPWSTSGPDSMTGALDPESGLWTTKYTLSDFFGPGVASPGTIHAAVDPGAELGTYTIGIIRGDYLSRPWATVFPAISGPDFVVHVVPETTSLWLLLATLFYVRRSSYR